MAGHHDKDEIFGNPRHRMTTEEISGILHTLIERTTNGMIEWEDNTEYFVSEFKNDESYLHTIDSGKAIVFGVWYEDEKHCKPWTHYELLLIDRRNPDATIALYKDFRFVDYGFKDTFIELLKSLQYAMQIRQDRRNKIGEFLTDLKQNTNWSI